MEHDHTEQPPERLNVRLQELSEIDKDWQCRERRYQVQYEIGLIAFELSCRYAESKDIEIEEAWSQHGE